jgi:hypothetical protein
MLAGLKFDSLFAFKNVFIVTLGDNEAGIKVKKREK